MNRLKFFVVACAAVFMASCSNMVQNKVAMPVYNTDSSTSLYDVLGVEEVSTELKAPTEIIVSLYEYSDRIKVSWSAVPNAASYRLERAIVTQKNAAGGFTTPDESQFGTIVHTKALYSTSYTDIIISGTASDPLNYTNEKYGYAYFYRVCAENERGGFEPSEYIVSTRGMLMAPPKKVEASMGEYSEYVEIDWVSAEGAASYEIWRSSYSDGSNAIKIGSVTTLHYSDSGASLPAYQGKDLFYKIIAVSSTGAKSVDSPVAMGYTLLAGAPQRVGNVTVETGHGDITASDSITIKWEKVPSVTGGKDIYYVVYRSTSKDSSLDLLGEVKDLDEKTDSKNLKPNIYYYYRVQAYFIEEDGTKNKGPMSLSGPDSAKPAEAFILSPPPSVVVSKMLTDSSKSTIKFAPTIGDKAYIDNNGRYNNDYEYVVYGGETDKVVETEVARLKSSGLNALDGYYVVTIPSYSYYKMQTEFSGKKSDYTEVVAPAPYAAEEVYVTRAALVGDISNYQISGTDIEQMDTEKSANANGVHPVRITWAPPLGGAEGGYHIYRSEKFDSGYRKVTENPVTDLYYIDDYSSAKAGVIYYYKVLSLNSLGQGANYSVVDKPIVENNFISLTKGRGYGWGALSMHQYLQEQRKTVVTSQKKLTLMHKPNNLDKLGSETINGDICGTLSYKSEVSGTNGVVTMPYKDYADAWIQNDPSLGIFFFFNGNTNTKANMSANGQMNGIVDCKGMYPGKVRYDNVEIKGGNAGGGTYGVIREGIESDYKEIHWKAAN